MKKELFVVVCIGWIGSAVVFAQIEKGAQQMILRGGKTGDVPFPHAVHQSTIQDCAVCHKLFPQTPGGLEALKTAGKIQKKQVMQQCQQCHRTKEKAGEKTGPTRCKSCHSG